MARPSKSSNELYEIIRKLYILGKIDLEVCAIVGISKSTLNNWKKKNPEFFASIKEAKSLADTMVEASLFDRATGYTHPEEKIFCNKYGEVTRVMTNKHYAPDVLAQIFWLKNRAPDKWREKIEPLDSPPGLKDVKISKKSFTEFVITAGYPAPFPEQIDFVNWCLYDHEARMLLGSRGYGKTDYITILGIAYLIYCDYIDSMNAGTKPTFSCMIATKTGERNTSIMYEIAIALNNNEIPLETENSEKVVVKNKHGKDASVFGRTIKSSWRGPHPDMIVMDDPVTEEDTSEATRKLVKKKYNEGFKLTSNIVIIGQPAHEHDLYAELRDTKVKLKLVPHGTIKELDHDLEAQRLAGVDEKSIQASYHLKIVSDGTNPFDGVKYIDKFPTGSTAVAFIDPSHEGGDTTAVTIFKQHMQGIVCVGFVWKKAWHHCVDDINQKLQKYGVVKCAFETNGLGEQPLDILRQVFKGIGVVGRRSNNNKHSRIMAAGAYAKMIHLCNESDKGYIDQVRYYEYNAKVDDAPDSLATGLEWIGLIRGKL